MSAVEEEQFRISTKKHQPAGYLWIGRLLARYVQDRVRFVRMVLQFLDGLHGRKNEQGDLAASSFAFHVVHHGQGARSSANDQTTATPRNFLFDRNWCVPELIAELLR